MSSMAGIIVIFFIAFAIIFGITIWMDTKRVYIHAPKFNYKNGNSETTGENATAEHDENEKKGEVIAKAVADGSGNAIAFAELGYEYQNTGKLAVNYVIEYMFNYRVNLEANSDTANVKGKVETFLNSKLKTITDDCLTTSGKQSNPENEGVVEASGKHKITLKPGEKFTAYLKLTAVAEGADKGECTSEVVAKLREISYRTELSL